MFFAAQLKICLNTYAENRAKTLDEHASTNTEPLHKPFQTSLDRRLWVKINHQGTAGFHPCFHLPGFHSGYLYVICDPHPGPEEQFSTTSLRSSPTLESPCLVGLVLRLALATLTREGGGERPRQGSPSIKKLLVDSTGQF